MSSLVTPGGFARIALLGALMAGCISTPIPDRPISLAGKCSQTEEDGFHEDAVLRADNNQVSALSWQIRIGRRGACQFEYSQFRQTKTRPHIELLANSGDGCKLMVWQDSHHITLAHAGCERYCTGGIYDEAWPALFDPATGGCAAR